MANSNHISYASLDHSTSHRQPEFLATLLCLFPLTCRPTCQDEKSMKSFYMPYRFIYHSLRIWSRRGRVYRKGLPSEGLRAQCLPLSSSFSCFHTWRLTRLSPFYPQVSLHTSCRLALTLRPCHHHCCRQPQFSFLFCPSFCHLRAWRAFQRVKTYLEA